MSFKPFHDRRASGLLDRVRDDIGKLREDLGDLLSHTTRRTLPNGAKDLTSHAKQGLAAGSAYAVSQLRRMRGRRQPQYQPAGWLGGAVVLGLVAYGAYALFQKSCDSGHDIPIDRDNERFPGQDDLVI